MPRALLFASGDAAVALGVARSALNAFAELASDKSARATPGLLREQPMVQADIGLAEAKLRASRAFLKEAVRDVWTTVSGHGTLTLEQRATLRIAATHSIRQAVEIVDTVHNAAGATSIYDGHILQRAFQDIHVISQHLQARRIHYEIVGRHWLGLEIDTSRL